MEVLFHGCKTLIIENSEMRAVILVEKGLNLVSYVLKKADTDFIWTNPMGLSCLEKGMHGAVDSYAQSDNYAGGCFGIFPNVGHECTVNGIHFPDHAEEMYLPWHDQVLYDSEERILFEFTVKLSKYPVFIRKTLEITEGSPALRFEAEIHNLGKLPLPYQCGVHPCIGRPFLNGHCEIETPFLPTVTFPDEGSYQTHLDIYDCLQNGYADLRDPVKKIGFGISWDTDMFPYCALWISANNAVGHHRMSGDYVASVLPMNTRKFGLDTAVADGNCPVIEGDSKRAFWYTLTLFSSESRPSGIDRKGNIIL